MKDPSAIRERFTAVARDLNERSRRLLAAAKLNRPAMAASRPTSRATGIAREVRGRGLKDHLAALVSGEEVRRLLVAALPNFGRGKGSTLLDSPRGGLVEPATMGDPMRPLLWVSKSHAKLAAALREMGHKIADSSIPKLLGLLEYSRQVNRKTLEGSHNPDRNAQFRHHCRGGRPGGGSTGNLDRHQEKGTARRL